MTDDQDDEGIAVREVAVTGALTGTRLDKALATLCQDYSRSRLRQLIDSGNVMLNGTVCDDASLKVTEGQVLSFTAPEPVAGVPRPEDIPLNIVYEDAHLLVIDKQAGLVVHPGAGNWDGTLVNALLYHCGDTLSGIGGVIRPGIVHRLDKDTSGLMVVAKSDAAHRGLAAQLEDRSLSRTYTALVWRVPQAKGLIDKPISRSANNRMKMAIATQGGREARTRFHRLAAYREAAALVECALETGRTHQIRVHMQAIGYPLVGDPLYGLQNNAALSLLRKGGYGQEVMTALTHFPRQALHATRIRFFHPFSDEDMGFESSIPRDMGDLIGALKNG